MGEKTPRLICSGGALLNSAVLQAILADTLDASLYSSRDTEASARGAALLALEALGHIPDVAQITPDVGSAVAPDQQRGEIYRKAAARQKDLYQKLIGN
jgi:gluconokinase